MVNVPAFTAYNKWSAMAVQPTDVLMCYSLVSTMKNDCRCIFPMTKSVVKRKTQPNLFGPPKTVIVSDRKAKERSAEVGLLLSLLLL